MTITDNIVSGSAVVLAIIAIVLSFGLTGQENVYACEDKQLAMQCDSLSAVNGEGLNTRCYFNDGIKDTYKVCNSGWLKYNPVISDSNITEINETICRLIKGEDLVKECVTSDNETYLYMVGFK